MAKINKMQKYSVLWLHSQGLDIDSILSETKVSKKQIENIINEHQEIINKPGIQTKTSQVNGSRSKNLMITETSSKTRNVSIMTKEASQLNDELKKKNHSIPKNQQGIYRPNSK
jgi:hypothetical protein